ncbi:hypothetical protein FQN54_009089 [Arachnomyces sp. PD_36]|nr:hypothetical protein FQN54_009089 [Arachnomyces sp. PD_36]
MANQQLTSAYAYRWKEPARPMLNIYHYRKRYGVDNPQFGLADFEKKESTQSVVSSGLLGKLPVELLYKIFLDLDIFSLEMVRELNAYFKRVLDGFREFRLLKQHASETFRIMYGVDIHHVWTLSEIFTEFTHPWCRTCGRFGPFVFLLTFTRCCYNCLLDHEDYELAPAYDLAIYYMLTKEECRKLPVLRSLRNDYGTYKCFAHDTETLVASFKTVSELSMEIYGSTENLNKCKKVRDERALVEFNSARSRMRGWLDIRHKGDFPPPPKPVRPACFKSFVFNKRELLRYRFMASTAFPYWDLAKEKVETGAYCSACTKHWEEPEGGLRTLSGGPEEARYYMAFMEEELPDHFRECEATKRGLVRENRTLERFPGGRSGENFLVEF